MTTSEPTWDELLKGLQEAAGKGSEIPFVCHSWEEYREYREGGFGGYAPRAGELNSYEPLYSSDAHYGRW